MLLLDVELLVDDPVDDDVDDVEDDADDEDVDVDDAEDDVELLVELPDGGVRTPAAMLAARLPATLAAPPDELPVVLLIPVFAQSKVLLTFLPRPSNAKIMDMAIIELSTTYSTADKPFISRNNADNLIIILPHFLAKS